MDLDDTLREMTVGDLAVPRHVKRAVAVVQDRYARYGAALDAPQADSLLNAEVEHGLPGLQRCRGLGRARICAYIREVARALELQTGAQVLGGHLAWPQVHAVTGDGTSCGLMEATVTEEPDWNHAVKRFPKLGLQVERAASPEEREDIARALDLIACSSLIARYAHCRPAARGTSA